MQHLRIFLASSSELKADREQFEIFLARRNKTWLDKGIFLDLVIWEDFLDALAPSGLQAEYNKALVDCQIFVMLFHSKVGKYTAEEFRAAHGAFLEKGRPLIYTYFKDTPPPAGQTEEAKKSLEDFKAMLGQELKHYWTVYDDHNRLCLHFWEQLEKLEHSGRLSALVTPKAEAKPAPSAPPSPAKVRKLLEQAFTRDDFFVFCSDNFPKVYQEIDLSMPMTRCISALLDHARTRNETPRLLELVKEANPEMYAAVMEG